MISNNSGIRSLSIILLFFLMLFYACKSNPYQQGAVLYNSLCANCHMEDGMGLEGLIPPLAGADYLETHAEMVPCIIRYGMEGEVTVNGRVFDQPMAGVPELTETQITNIVNYMNHAWGNDLGYTTFGEVREAIEKCEE